MVKQVLNFSIRRSAFLITASALLVMWLGPTSLLAEQQKDRNTGYYFTYTCISPDGRTRADRVSNIYYTSLDWKKRADRVRAILGGYKGCMGDMGAFGTTAQAEEYRKKFYHDLPTFAVPDPLE